MPRCLGMIWIVNQIVISSVRGTRAIMFVNKDGVIDVENWEIGEIRDEKLAAGESLFQLLVGFRLIIFAVEIKHPPISGPEISDPAQSNVALQQSRVGRAQLAQIAISGNYDPPFRR